MTRPEKLRLGRAENVCRELRFALAHPQSADWEKVCAHLQKWLRVGPPDKYVRASKR